MADISASALVELAVDLTNGLNSSDRFERLLRTIRSTISCDAVVILRHISGQLRPLAQLGLSRDALGRRFAISEHPRFNEICQANGPTRFAADCGLPDPYDGMMLSHEGNLPVHACMGMPLVADDTLIGVLTLDSMTPNVFDDIPQRTLDIVAAMSAATLKNAILLDQLEALSNHNQQVVTELTNEALAKDGGELIGSSVVMAKLKQEIKLVAPSDYTVLIQGETGVGKELVARTLHRESRRADKALVYLNCAAIPETLVESELFGHVKGAFTGADKDRAGKFSLADKGTLFLDEVGELPLATQSKLLRAIQNKEIQAVGRDQIQQVDVRVIAATNRDLEKEVSEGRFRADLYHRLVVYPLLIKPLRERREDIAELVGFFCEQLRRKLDLRQLVAHKQAISALETYGWPGNVRELEHVLSRAALKARSKSSGPIIEINHTDFEGLHSPSQEHRDTQVTNETFNAHKLTEPNIEPPTLKERTDAFQKNLIVNALRETDGNWARAARMLGVDRANLKRVATRLDIHLKKNISIG